MAGKFAPVEQFIDRIIEQGQVNGAGVAIAVKGEAVFEDPGGGEPPGSPAPGEKLWAPASLGKAQRHLP